MSADHECRDADTVTPIQELPDGTILAEHHTENHETEIATFRRAREGVPLPDKFWVGEGGGVYRGAKLGSGPAQVATKTYRDNYDRTFGSN